MDKKERKIWFPAKKYGFGWGLPATWQGWAVVITYTALVLLGSRYISKNTGHTAVVLIFITVLTAIFIWICYRKGEKPAWRWGQKDKAD